MILRKLALLATIAIAATALVATTAHAKMEPAEVSEEHLWGNQHCAPDECVVHMVNEEPILLELFGEVASICNHEFAVEILEDGSGGLFNQTLTGSNCGLQPCDVTHWPIETWEAGPADFRLEMAFCVTSPVFDPIDCHLEGLRIHREGFGGHNFEVTALAEPCEETPEIHMTGHWTFEASDQGSLEVDHAS